MGGRDGVMKACYPALCVQISGDPQWSRIIKSESELDEDDLW
jgi:hypothetical protein